jgi:hypothetical protein
MDFIERVALFVFGILISGHYLLIANYIKRAPHLIKIFALPATAASGVGMAVCGASGDINLGAHFALAASVSMIIVNVSAWLAGAYISEQFEKAARVREQIHRDGLEFVTQFNRLLDLDLSEKNEPKKKRKQAENL